MTNAELWQKPCPIKQHEPNLRPAELESVTFFGVPTCLESQCNIAMENDPFIGFYRWLTYWFFHNYFHLPEAGRADFFLGLARHFWVWLQIMHAQWTHRSIFPLNLHPKVGIPQFHTNPNCWICKSARCFQARCCSVTAEVGSRPWSIGKCW